MTEIKNTLLNILPIIQYMQQACHNAGSYKLSRGIFILALYINGLGIQFNFNVMYGIKWFKTCPFIYKSYLAVNPVVTYKHTQ